MRKLLLSALFLSLLTACPQKDEEKPNISISSPSAGKHYKQGDTITLIVTFKDNKQLSQGKINIHHDGDGHSHGKTAYSYTKWNYNEIIDLEGSEETKELSINIPDDAEIGEYGILIECTDLEGNEADFLEQKIHINLK